MRNDQQATIIFTAEEFVELMKKERAKTNPKEVIVWIDGINIAERERIREAIRNHRNSVNQILKQHLDQVRGMIL